MSINKNGRPGHQAILILFKIPKIMELTNSLHHNKETECCLGSMTREMSNNQAQHWVSNHQRKYHLQRNPKHKGISKESSRRNMHVNHNHSCRCEQKWYIVNYMCSNSLTEANLYFLANWLFATFKLPKYFQTEWIYLIITTQ